jgi:hypothetical protein
MLRIRRACYDKPHRCPGWAGGGFRYANTAVCDSGSIPYSDSKFDHWLVKRCATCGTVRLPIVTRWLDPSFVSYILRARIRSLMYDRQMAREWRAGDGF